MMGYNIELYPYLPKYKYIFFFISFSGRIRILIPGWVAGVRRTEPLDSDPTNSRKKTLISPNNIQLCLDSLIKSRIIKVKMICMAKEVDLN